MTPTSWTREGHDWPNRSESQFLRAGVTHWHVQRMGEGPVMLLLHGAGGATHSWRDLMPLLACDHDVVAPDLPGHAFSSAPPGAASSLPAMAREIACLLDTLGVQPDIIVGHSAGAAIAVELTMSGRIAPRMLVGLNAALTPFHGLAGALFPPMAKILALNPATPLAVSRLAGWSRQSQRLIEGTGSKLDARGLALYTRLLGSPRHVSGTLSMMAHWDLEPMLVRLPSLTTPLHLLAGTRDATVPPEGAERLAKGHAHINFMPIDGLGHLMHEEAPEKFATLIREQAVAPTT